MDVNDQKSYLQYHNCDHKIEITSALLDAMMKSYKTVNPIHQTVTFSTSDNTEYSSIPDQWHHQSSLFPYINYDIGASWAFPSLSVIDPTYSCTLTPSNTFIPYQAVSAQFPITSPQFTSCESNFYPADLSPSTINHQFDIYNTDFD
ncbi:10359_t:CDS:2 [Dentiscutata erythropus]|uniref:10359_t:CDS:1 n=1 Tax=Dentiscutata erythropus TaxID=1348616 RepID=A0A9N8ZJM0_9GLOM|nr:10359_t:CDS:2 [Dentiscutata erythropus]